MHAPIAPVDETARLKALRDYAVLDTLPEQALDDLTTLAAHICGTPVSLISLIDEKRQWFKSKVGVEIDETPREVSFCQHAITQSDLYVVGDAELDRLFANNPLVTGEPHIRFYAGAPLIVPSGHAIGTLCVIDRVPRQLSQAQRDALMALARQTMAQLELRRHARELRADIVRREQIELALRQSEQRYRTLFQYAPDGILIADADSFYLDANTSMCTMLGYAPSELIGLHASDIVAPQEEVQIAPALKAISQGDYQREWRFRRRDGSSFTADVIATQMPDGKLLAMVRDTTERNRAIAALREVEEQYQQAQKMEAVGRLAGGIAHDFNNLLTAILGYCELLMLELPADDRCQEDVVEIQKASLRAASLTRQLLAFSRKQIIEPRSLALNEVVSDIRSMLGRLIGEDITMSTKLEPGLRQVRADRGQIEQVLVNLAVNARDAMASGGALTIETANVEIDESSTRGLFDLAPGRYVRLTIADTGTGMPPEVQARVFEPFFTTKEVGKGTGLGLATVHAIITHGGGTVHVESAVNRGTTFVIHLPCSDDDDAPAQRMTPTTSLRGAGETVLVVEDEDALRELARRLLSRLGYDVVVAANADEAQAMFESHGHIDLLLTDVVMPGGSGPELTRRLATQTPALKVIYMSGYTEESIVRHGVIDPGIAFLHKPFSSETLGRKLREVLAH